MQLLAGNVQGLKASERQLLERIYRRRVDPGQVVSPELAGFLCQCAQAVERQVGVLLDRQGNVTHVVVGDAHKLVLPDLGRARAGSGRLRGLRLVHTHLRSEPLSRDDLVDLAKLRLDLMAVIGLRPDGSPGQLAVAHLLPENERGELWRELPPVFHSDLDLHCGDLIRSLEEELARASAARAEGGRRDRAVLVHVAVGSGAELEGRIAELRELARTAGVLVVDVVVQRRAQPDPRYLIGKGKLEDTVLRALQRDATLLIFDPELTPTQARSISEATELKVIDRTMLILDIFAQRAKSRDGKIQVELAQLKYTLPRLAEKNTMMSRLTGGIGGRGPGETKLEINRRRAREKIQLYEEQIREVAKQRGERRSLRTARGLPIVAIVGYTNAGKSTLLNSLTESTVLAEDQLFATLDPTTRRLRFPRDREIVISDTVGFIRDLPHDLLRAFRATLEELDQADLLLHVIDAADPRREEQTAAVERILGELKLDGKRRLLVYNKADRAGWVEAEALAREGHGLAIAANDRATLRPLLLAVERVLWEEDRLPPSSLREPPAGDEA